MVLTRNLNTSKGKPVTSNSSARKMVELEEMKKKAPDEPPNCGRMTRGCMTVVQTRLKIKQRDLAMKATYEGLLLKAKDQIQTSSMYDMEESWTELNPRVGSQAMNVFSYFLGG